MAASDEMKEYEQASAAYGADGELMEMIREYNTDREALAMASADGQADELITKALGDRIAELESDIAHSEVFERYSKAGEALRELMDAVFRAVSEAAYGSGGAEGCSGDCSRCSGCRHG